MKLAIVHESFDRLGGAERVVAEIIRAFPSAHLYALEGSAYAPVPPKVSFLRYLPRAFRLRRWTLPLLPLAAETFDLSAYDVVISSASAFAKGLVTRLSTIHLCYCHAATRFLWDAAHAVKRGPTTRILCHALRLWDRQASARVTEFIANSETTRDRIRRYYGREAVVIPPPLPLVLGPATYHARRAFLYLGRLTEGKGVSLVIQVFNKLGLPLVVAGTGRSEKTLRRAARANVTFLGFVANERLASLYGSARAVIFPSDDDFGLVPVEAMAYGTPVIALRRGGATETVTEGVTGEFFNEPIEELLAEAIRRFLEREGSYAESRLTETAERFSAKRFRRVLKTFVARALKHRSMAAGR